MLQQELAGLASGKVLNPSTGGARVPPSAERHAVALLRGRSSHGDSIVIVGPQDVINCESSQLMNASASQSDTLAQTDWRLRSKTDVDPMALAAAGCSQRRRSQPTNQRSCSVGRCYHPASLGVGAETRRQRRPALAAEALDGLIQE